MNQRDDFVRIAMAIIKRAYPFKPQRLAVASKMYRRWIERKELIITEIDENGSNVPEALMNIFKHYNEDADPYKEVERIRMKANEIGYDFDYGLSAEPTNFWKIK